MKKSIYFFIAMMAMLGCRKDPKPLPAEISRIDADPTSKVKGLYLVNEGNMNMNKASLDYLDLINGLYTRNFYEKNNPQATRGLGDVANDVAIYGSKMYVVVNASNKVEVLDAKSGRRISQINLVNCRYITFQDGKAYVSAYFGKINDLTAATGIVAKIDTASLAVDKTVEVGRQPEQMAVVGNKLYVANSGGYSPPNYESTISVLDLNNFVEVKRINVAINLHRLKADRYGDLYVTSRGDYYDIPSKLIVVDTQTDKVKKVFDIAASNFAIDDDLAYVFGTEWNYLQGKNTISYHLLDVKNETLLDRQFIVDGTNRQIIVPFGIAVNPYNKDLYITDAKDYVTPGKLYCYTSFGILKWSVTTGDIPAHIAFAY